MHFTICNAAGLYTFLLPIHPTLHHLNFTLGLASCSTRKYKTRVELNETEEITVLKRALKGVLLILKLVLFLSPSDPLNTTPFGLHLRVGTQPRL
jgi:hypothetical protein